MIVNKTSKVYGPSIKNFYEAGTDLGLTNLMSLGILVFFEQNKQSTIKLRGDLNS